MDDEYVGWIVEWSQGSRKERKRGIVVEIRKKKRTLLVFEENGQTTTEIPLNSQIVKIKPGDLTDVQLKLNIEKRLHRLERNDPVTHDFLVQILHGLEQRGVNPEKTILKAIENTKNQEIPLVVEEKKNQIVEIPIVDDEESGDDDEDNEDEEDEDEEEDDEEVSDEENEDETSDVESNNEDEEAEEIDEDEESEEEDEEVDDEEDEDEDDNDEEEDDDDDVEEEGEEEDSEIDDSSSSSDDDDDDRLDVKVYIYLPPDLSIHHIPLMNTADLKENQEALIVRGFNLNKFKIITKLTRLLTKDYKRPPVFYYRDKEKDEIMVSKQSDLKYILKIFEKEIERKRKYDLKLKLIAKFPPEKQLPSQHLKPQTLPLEPNETNIISTKIWNQRDGIFGLKSPRHHNETDDLGTLESISSTTSMLFNGTNEFIWQKGELIGSGSFGQVYSAIDLATGKKIAVKEVYISGTKGHREQAEALKTEIKVLSSLNHPNIVKYHGAECTKDTLRIFLDLASDGSVKDILSEFGSLAEPVLRRYTKDMLTGLAFLHSKGYIHRDIKPSNLLLDNNVIKLADFGCTTSVQLGNDGMGSDVHNTIIGTTIYMSPEVMRGSETEDNIAPTGYGRKADIWSVGITLVEMATAKLPFRNAASAIYTICVSKEYPTLPSEMSIEAHHFLSRCLVENPKERASCEELLIHAFCRPMTSLHSKNERMRTSTLVLQPEIDLECSSPRETPPGSFEGLDSTDGDSVRRFHDMKKISWNDCVSDEENDTWTTEKTKKIPQSAKNRFLPDIEENMSTEEDATIKKGAGKGRW